ncbi:uncharacterized protein BX663DRAFT_270760 [Cokeromyces recurvatus]|uniref:uncharacterized protein n=1 Tax=Cokeromyces recurvatus TaxID=90255 RepID=UPI00221F56A0|nr:uncharacterized protein BX663DRAFT_270760 [Cokeromyces recurvatus]KAI7898073.1 hypothetical protein BX663DRAFT_270760 [Cokeromyces recurvatus]
MNPLPDPLTIASGPISAYMSGHDKVNLAYAKYFGKKTDAVSATFKSLNSKGFLIVYKTMDGSEHEVFIEYIRPVTKREDVRPVLEDMAEEAEAALGMPSSRNGPPPLKALMKAAEIEEAQKTEIEKLHQQDDEDAKMSARIASQAVGNIFEEVKENTLDVFYPADRFWQAAITMGLGTNALLGYASDDFLRRLLLPSSVVIFRNYLTMELIRKIFVTAIAVHIVEGLVALGICLKRRWYSPMNTFKWTLSTVLYGYASMTKLLGHCEKSKEKKKDDLK